jgi:hypothetical protein
VVLERCKKSKPWAKEQHVWFEFGVCTCLLHVPFGVWHAAVFGQGCDNEGYDSFVMQTTERTDFGET